MTQRWKLLVEYDGTPFNGWQRQEDHLLTVQKCIEDAVFKFCGEKVAAFVAGRTDAGVHAMGQVAHVDIARPTNAETVRDALNYYLKPYAVGILEAEAVPHEWHARFGACYRVYCYRLVIGRRTKLTIEKNRAWQIKKELDVDAMQQAARYLIGHHDFSTFRDSDCQAKSPIKTLDRLEILRKPDYLTYGQHIEIWAEAQSFLHHQVRNMVGTLKLVGDGKWQPDDVKAALEAKDRTAGGPTAPAHGLYFMRVDYRPLPHYPVKK